MILCFPNVTDRKNRLSPELKRTPRPTPDPPCRSLQRWAREGSCPPPPRPLWGPSRFCDARGGRHPLVTQGNFNWGDPAWGASLSVTTYTVTGRLPQARLCWPWPGGRWLLSGALSASNDVIWRFFFFSPLTRWILLTDFECRTSLMHPGQTHLAVVYNPFCALLDSTCWRFVKDQLPLCSREIWACPFSRSQCPRPVLELASCWAPEMGQAGFPPLLGETVRTGCHSFLKRRQRSPANPCRPGVGSRESYSLPIRFLSRT